MIDLNLIKINHDLICYLNKSKAGPISKIWADWSRIWCSMTFVDSHYANLKNFKTNSQRTEVICVLCDIYTFSSQLVAMCFLK